MLHEFGYKRTVAWKRPAPEGRILQWYRKGLEYALVSNDYQQCNEFVWCKDFLQDIIQAAIQKRVANIYHFLYDPRISPPPCLDRVRLIVANDKDKKFREKIPGCLDFINQVEASMGMKRSFARECWSPPEKYEKGGVWMFEGSRRWIIAPPMLSLYTLLLRVGFVHTPGKSFRKTIEAVKVGLIKPYQNNDRDQLRTAEPAIEKIMRVGDRKVFYRDMRDNYPSHIDIETMHNEMGIAAFAFQMEQRAKGERVPIPYWHFYK